MRPAGAPNPELEIHLAELMMSTLVPCDLGHGIEVVHDVEAVEVEMECSVDDDRECSVDDDFPDDTTEEDLGLTTRFARALEIAESIDEHGGTRQFERHSAPYERIEIQLDASAYRRATIEDAKRLQRRHARRRS